MWQDPRQAERAAWIARAVAHPVRLRILAYLAEQGAYVMDLTTALGRRQANISQHLMVLREAGLVQAEREGMMVRYTLRSELVADLLALLARLAEGLPEEPSMGLGPRRFRRGRGRGRW